MQLTLSSLPMLLVLISFLYSAAIRPNELSIYPEGVDDDDVIQQYFDRQGLIPLYQIVYTFLGFFVMWSVLASYIIVFVPKRRRLMESYLNPSEVENVVGDVYFQPTTTRCHLTDYAYAVYAHRQMEGYLVQKRVRTYHPYTREKIAVVVLKGKPYSGQPKTDIDIDIKSYSGDRDKTNYATWFSLLWVVFTLLGSIYVMFQMSKIDHPKQPHMLREFFGIVMIVTPIFAIGGNWLKWRLHYNWVVNRGETVRDENLTPTSKEKAFTKLKEEDNEINTCLSDTCGGDEMIYGDHDSLEMGIKNDSKTHYLSMT